MPADGHFQHLVVCATRIAIDFLSAYRLYAPPLLVPPVLLKKSEHSIFRPTFCTFLWFCVSFLWLLSSSKFPVSYRSFSSCASFVPWILAVLFFLVFSSLCPFPPPCFSFFFFVFSRPGSSAADTSALRWPPPSTRRNPPEPHLVTSFCLLFFCRVDFVLFYLFFEKPILLLSVLAAAAPRRPWFHPNRANHCLSFL